MASLHLFVLFGQLSICLSARILLFPYDHLAHVNYFSLVGQELKRSGHTVDIIIASRSQHLAKDRGLNAFVQDFEITIDNTTAFETAAKGGALDKIRAVGNIFAIGIKHVKHVLQDEAFLQTLRANQYDLVLVEGTSLGRSHMLLPYKLGVKYIAIQVRHEPWPARIPSLPSVESMQGIYFLNEDSTFFDRLINIILTLIVHNLVVPPSYISGINDALFDELVPERPNIGFDQLQRNSEMFLVAMDILCLDNNRVSAPHYQFIGGLGANDAKPLPPKLQQFMDSARDGVMVLTFGSICKTIPQDMLEGILSIVSDLKQKLILRHDGDVPQSVPGNVLIQKWLPQNDLLGHPNTKVFITHAGANGQMESTYHGVPMLMLPQFDDQPYNAKRAEKAGYGLIADPKNFNVEDFRSKLMALLNNPSYFEKSQKCSKILHGMHSPQQKAVFWIEHVLQYGSNHLRPYYIDMPMWKFWMIDILIFVSVLGIIILCGFKWCCMRCFRKNTVKAKKE